MNPFAIHPSKDIHKTLFKNVITSDWQKVIAMYKNEPEAHTAKITKSGDTALHMAISDGQVFIERLVSIVDETTLRISNAHGNTPLHLAAYQGNVAMCQSIASRDPKLLGIRNKDYLTPLFLAVVYGRKDAFLSMHCFCTGNQGYEYGRRKNGRTILHSAISGEYLDLAFQIIRLYDKLPNWNDERGISPLHLLAGKPSAFRSGSRMRGLHKLIYHCIPVKKLTLTDIPSQGRQCADNAKNSPTSFSLIHRLRIITWLPGSHRVRKTDAENPSGQQTNGEKDEPPITMAPKNNWTCFYGLKLVFKTMGLFLGLGPIRIQKIREEKEKHIWSVQIMEILLKSSSTYECQYGGNSRLSTPKEGEIEAPYDFDDSGIVQYRGDQLKHHQPDNSLEAGQSNKGERNRNEKEHKTEKEDKAAKRFDKESPLLIAAKNGVVEMVEKILEDFPVAIHDMNIDGRNAVLLAVKNRQPDVYNFLLNRKMLKETTFYRTDNDGNSALHLAAECFDTRNWNVSGPALQMQWEIKCYEHVENSMPPNFFVRYNNQGKTPWDKFRETHGTLVNDASKWLNKTSQSCATVATLIATVAFAASTTIPGGVKSESGTPILEKEPAFNIFAISTLIALCFSISSVVMFLVFFTPRDVLQQNKIQFNFPNFSKFSTIKTRSSSQFDCRYHEKDFGVNLPAKLLVELTSLLISIAAVLVSFCAAHFFVIKDNLKYTAFPLYAATCLPVALYAVWQLPTYIDLAVATYDEKPQRIYDYN